MTHMEFARAHSYATYEGAKRAADAMEPQMLRYVIAARADGRFTIVVVPTADEQQAAIDLIHATGGKIGVIA